MHFRTTLVLVPLGLLCSCQTAGEAALAPAVAVATPAGNDSELEVTAAPESSWLSDALVGTEERPLARESGTERGLPYLPREGAEPWVFGAGAYVWFLGLDGHMRANNTAAEVDTSFGDIWADLSWVFEGRASAHKGKWGAKFDGTFAKLETDGSSGGVDVDVDTKIGLFLLAGTYTAYERKLEENQELSFDAVVGFMNTSLDLDFDSNAAPLDGQDKNESWLDLFFGVDCEWRINQRNRFLVSGLAGGWNMLGDSSDSIWGVEGLYGYSFGKKLNWNAYAGYRLLAIDYDPGNAFAFNVNISGPMLGLAYGF